MHAQTSEAGATPETSQANYQTFYLSGITNSQDASEIVTDLRNMLPKARIYIVASQNAISMRGSTEDMQLAQKILADLNHTRKTYRLTYTFTDTDGGKQVQTQHLSVILIPGERSTVKMGSKVPIVTGRTNENPAAAESQVQYLDVGLNIDARLGASPEGLRLNTKIEQSSVADEKPSAAIPDPILHQSVLETTASLSPDKPTVVGSLDIPDSTRRREVSVSAQLLQ